MQTILITTSTFAQFDLHPLDLLRNAGYEPVLNPHGRKLSTGELAEMMTMHQPVGLLAGTEKISGEVLRAHSSHLKVVSRVGTGMDNVDSAAAFHLGIQVYRTPDAPTRAVAELTVGIMLSLLRKIARADRELRNGAWNPYMGNLLSGKTVGIIGCGRIGRNVARILKNGFGADVVAYDLVMDASMMEKIGVKFASSLEELLEQADIVSLHVPGNDSGAPVLGAGQLNRMKPGALLINTARGGLADENELKVRVDDGRLGGVGLDVYGKEPYAGPLLGCANTLLTMHMGSYAVESRINMETEAVLNLLEGLTKAGLRR